MGQQSGETGGCCGGEGGTNASSCCENTGNHNKTVKCCCPNNTACCDSNATIENSNSTDLEKVLCLAVVRENGADMVLFDSEGTPRSFSYHGDTRKICFSTHGHSLADEFLSPCFDEGGRHGVPDEGCFCGVDTPHLHAHLHDTKTCQDNSSKLQSPESDDFMYLAGLTLHPTHVDGGSHEDLASKDASRLLHWGITDQLPKQCNSDEVSHLIQQTGRARNRRSTRRMSKVHHDDHVDYLVHDASTGDLHLEHPCEDCGDNDVHGKFSCVGKRQLHSEDSTQMELHFFEVPARRFNILEHMQGLFDPRSADRVMAARTTTGGGAEDPLSATAVPTKMWCQGGTCTTPIDNDAVEDDVDAEYDPRTEEGRFVRSTFVLSEFCCASEIPLILDVLEAMPGVEKIVTNAPVRMVTVYHDPSLTTAQDIEKALNKERLGARIKVNGNAQRVMQSSTGRSHFYVQKICCASEIPAIRSIVCPMEGISQVSISVTTKMVYVEHDMSVVTATQIRDGLNADGFGASIKHDAAGDIVRTFVRSTLLYLPPSESSDPEMSALKSLMESFDNTQLDSFVVDVPSRKITVMHNPMLLPVGTIVRKLTEKVGVGVTVESDGATTIVWELPEGDESSISLADKVPNPSIYTILSGLFWVISMLSLIGGNWEYLKYVGLLSVVFGLPPIGLKAYRTVRRFQLDANVLMFTAAIGALALQEYTEAAAVTFLFSISEWLEVRATSRARSALAEIVRLRPERANLIHPVSNETMVVPASAVPIGSLVSVRTGDKIPCDGVVVEGNSTVDESSLTGESRPVRKAPNDEVSGGTINSGAMQLAVRTTATAENSAVSRLIRLVEEAQANRSPTEKLIDGFAKRYTPIVILAAVCMCTIPWAFGTDTGREWLYLGLLLIVVACPCALIISTPVTYVAGLAACAQRGIVVKGGAHLEALGMVRKIAFDKTGTLTRGSFDLLHLEVLTNRYTRQDVLQYLYVVEERASHPLAQALVGAAKNEKVTVPINMIAKNHTQLDGEGVTTSVNGVQVHVGNERLFRRLHLFDGLSEADKSRAKHWASFGGTVGFMSIEGDGVVCAFCVADAVRPEASSVVGSLHRLGIKLVMLTGDNADAALAIGNEVGLGVDEIRSQLLPEDKLSIVSDMMERRETNSFLGLNPCRPRDVVLMCGDGVNDAPALAAADVGVAMGAGAALAMETADVTLLDSRLDKLIYSIRMGKSVIWKIRENMIFSLVVKAVVVGFAFAGHAQLWAAIAADVGAMLLVTLNGMSLLTSRKRKMDHSGAKTDVEVGVY